MSAARKQLEDALLLEAFNAEFGADEPDIKVVKRLLDRREVRPWYTQYRQERSKRRQVPPQWAEAGLTPEDWANAQPKQEQRKQVRAAYAEELAQAAQCFESAKKLAEEKLAAGLQPLNEPIQKVLEADCDELPLQAYRRIQAHVGQEAREEQKATELAAAWKAWVAALKANQDPLP